MLMLCSKHSVQSSCLVKVILNPSLIRVNCTLFFIYLVSIDLLLDKKYTILSSTGDLLDKIDYLCCLMRLRNEKYNIPIMKYKFILFLILSYCSFISVAQSVSSTEDRLVKLEAQMDQQVSTITDLQSKVNAVIKQNMALKDALVLQPTISEFKTDELVYKLHEAVGDSTSGTVKVYMTVTNTSPEDIDHYQWQSLKFMDENGVQNKSFSDYEVSVGVNNDGFYINSLYTDAPTQLILTLKNMDKNAQYLKILEGKVYKGTVFVNGTITNFERSFVMRNIPIKWK